MSFWCCCEAPCTGTLTVVVTGCNDLPLEGASVEIWNDGILLDTLTTDANGEATLSGLLEGTYPVEVTKTRFDDYETTVLLHPVVECDTTTTLEVAMSPATGYTCCTNCANPRATTVYLTIGTTTETIVLGQASFDFDAECDGYGTDKTGCTFTAQYECPSGSSLGSHAGYHRLCLSVPLIKWINGLDCIYHFYCSDTFEYCFPGSGWTNGGGSHYLKACVDVAEDCEDPGADIEFTIPATWDFFHSGPDCAGSTTIPTTSPYSGTAIIGE
jgi:hypothetical protein